MQRAASRAGAVAALSLTALLGHAASAPAAPRQVELHCAAAPIELPIGRDPVPLRVGLPRGLGGEALLLIEEDGHTLSVTSTAAQRRVSVPPRLGVLALRLDAAVDLTLQPQTDGDQGLARLTLVCEAAGVAQHWDWFGRVDALDRSLQRGVGSSVEGEHEAALTAIEAASFDARSRAWARHLRAQRELMAGQSRSAAAAFDATADAWSRLGDASRALAARTAALEERNRLGEYATVLATPVADPAAPGPAARYYAARAQVAGCLAARYLSRFDAATECYAKVLARFDALGTAHEMAVAALDYGSIELELGRVDRAIGLFRDSRALLEGPRLGDERGRAELFLGWALMRRGDIAPALEHLQRAVAEFESSGSGRWLGSTLMRLGGWLAELGAHADASAALAEGMARFDETNAPGRIAAGMATQARIALASGRGIETVKHAEQAERLYRQLGQAREADAALVLIARGWLRAGDPVAARQHLDALSEARDDASTDARLLQIELDLRAGRLQQADAALQSVRRDGGMSIEQRRWFSLLRVDLLARRGELSAALDRLRDEHRHWARQAQLARSPLLRERLQQEQAAYARRAIDLLATAPAGAVAVDPHAALDAMLEWLPVAAVPEPSGGEAANGALSDRALASALFPSLVDAGEPSVSGSRILLDALARGGMAADAGVPPAAARIDWAGLQRSLSTGESLLVVLEGEDFVALARIERDRVVAPLYLDRASAMALAGQVSNLLHSAASSLSEVTAQALALRRLLRLDRDVAPQSAHVRVLTAGVWAELPWPLLLSEDAGSAAEQVVTLLSLVRGVPASVRATPERVIALAAADFSGSTLPALPVSGREAQAVRAIASGSLDVVASTATREGVLRALAAQQAWVHLASHGSVAPGRLGGSGLWLQSDRDGGAPGYLSGLEALDSGVRAELVVLNACRLGADGADYASASRVHGFSALLLRAGARQVVAALWSVSDTAGALWVDTFYRSAFARPERIAHAVASARQRLATSRAFRHPHHWAGLVHFEVQAVPADG